MLPLAAMVLTAACATDPRQSDLAAATPVFSPPAFFTGATVGDGVLRVGSSRARPVHVEGSGRVETDGTLVLVQRIEPAAACARGHSRVRTL